MSKLDKMIQLVTDSRYRFDFLAYRGYKKNLSDEEFLKKKWKLFYGTELNLENPQTLNEKLQWLKIYNRVPEYTNLVDKYEVKKIVSDMGISVIPTIGVWDNFDDIDFDKLPNRFVLKCTHDSGGYIVCKDKNKLNINKARKYMNNRLKKNYYDLSREWPYKNVKPRIIAEEYMDTLGNPNSIEYKITCFNGKMNFITVCRGKAHAKLNERKNDFYDRDFNFLPFRTNWYENSGIENQRPKELERMIEISEMIAKDIPYARVDCYVDKGTVYFGEITFFTWGGFMHFVPEEWNLKLGQQIELPPKKIFDGN